MKKKDNNKKVGNLPKEDTRDISDLELNELNQKVIFVRDGMPCHWLSCAEELIDAAELIWKNNNGAFTIEMSGEKNMEEGGIIPNESRKISQNSRTYFLLAGFAIENLFKGLIICQNPKNITNGKLNNNIKTHKILNLASKIPDVNLSAEEKEICQKIEGAIPYWGRYPIPLNFNGVTPYVGITKEIRNVIIGMFDRISKQLYDKIKDGWDSGIGAKSLKMRSIRYGDSIDLRKKFPE